MKKSAFLTAILFAISLPIFSQSLSSELSQLTTAISEVKTKKYTYTQTLEADSEKPYKLTLTIVRTDDKGKVREQRYLFNLADLDRNLVRYQASKDELTVKLGTSKKQDVIQFFEDGELQSYQKECEIYCTDVDNARQIEDAFESAIPKAGELALASLNVGTYAERMQWLFDHIGDVESGSTSYEQKLSAADGSQTLLQLMQVKKTSKKAETSVFEFDIADVNPLSVRLRVSGKDLKVEIETKRSLKYIAHTEDGERQSYDNDLTIYANDIENGQNIVRVLQELIPESEPKSEARLPKISSLGAGLEQLQKELREVDLGSKTIGQTIESTCITTATFNTTDSKGKQKQEVLKFNFSDILEQSIEPDVSGKEISVEAIIKGKEKLIAVTEDGEQQNFSNKLEFYAADAENAKQLQALLKQLVGACEESQKSIVSKGGANPMQWLESTFETLNEVNPDLEQSWSVVGGEKCNWQLKQIEIGKSKVKEEVYEFYLKDLDAASINFKVSGKKLAVEIPTVYQQKIIKYYKNGEVSNYKNSMEVVFQEVELARQFITRLKSWIEDCL